MRYILGWKETLKTSKGLHPLQARAPAAAQVPATVQARRILLAIAEDHDAAAKRKGGANIHDNQTVS